MVISDVIALLSLISVILIAIIGWGKDKSKSEKDEDNIIVEIRTEMKYNNKKLDSIDKRLDSIEEKLDTNAIKVAQHDRDIKTLFENMKLHLYRLRRLENHVGIGGEEHEERN